MSRTLLMIRHGRTRENDVGIFMGKIDVPCMPASLSAAVTLGRNIIVPTAALYIYTSPLQRCLHTVQAAFPGQTIQIDARLAERDLGSWGGQSKESLRVTHSGAFLANGKLNPNFTPPGGETLQDFCCRVVSFLEMAAYVGPSDATIVVVSHNGVIRLTRHLLDGLPIEEVFGTDEPHLTPIPLRFNGLSQPAFQSRIAELATARSRTL